MSRWVFDIETDDLLLKLTKMWMLAAYNLDTKTMHVWRDGDMGWQQAFSDATLLVGHNILGFDLEALWKLYKWKPNAGCKLNDTMILSQVMDYRRFGADGHSLEVWGDHLNFPKGKKPDFKNFKEEDYEYGIQDVRLGVKVYEILLDEVVSLARVAPNIGTYLRAESAVAQWTTKANTHGWPFDVEAATKLQDKLKESMELAYVALTHRLGTKTVAKDKEKGVVPAKKPKWTKQGFYDANTAKWFDIDPCSGFEGEERMVLGEYCRVEFVPLSLDSVADVKIFLYRNGWEPTEWNTSKETGERTTPKITEDSLEFLGGDGKLYTDFLTSKSRFSIVKTWLENTDENGMLHGDCFNIGTPSMRMRHSIIVNVPAVDSPWGKEMRSLFKCLPGWKLIGCDSSGNQARGLAHYLGDATFIDTLINGDIHTYNAELLDSVLKTMGVSWDEYIIKNDKAQLKKRIQKFLEKSGMSKVDYLKRRTRSAKKAIAGVKRASAKRILYAFLFGAAGAKLWSYIFGVSDKTKGNQLKNGFMKAVPGFKTLIEKLSKIFTATGAKRTDGHGYIPSIAGNRIYVDSYHKLLVYLLQACEKATCGAAVMLTMQRLEEANIPYVPLIMMHDEEDFMVPEEFAEQAAAIGKQAFADGPKLYGIEIMAGEAKIGDTWYDVH